MGQDGGHCLVEELPAGVPAEFSNRFPFPTESGDMVVLLVLLQKGDLSCLPPINPLAQLSKKILCRLHSPVSPLLLLGHV